ncbi:MxaK protein [Methylobacterium mesophilicum]
MRESGRRLWGRIRPRLLLTLPALLGLAALGFGVSAWRADAANRSIAALDAGTDLDPGTGAPAPVLVARVGYLAGHGRLVETEPLVAALDRMGASDAASRARYRVANARMREAFTLLTRGAIDKAGPQVTLARQEYRRALRERPDFWDAKFNLDVASRLIRDFPEFDRASGDELRAEPKQIWTDIPGQPRGGP